MKKESVQEQLTRLLMPGPHVWVSVCTVGGVDEDGNDVYEPEVFDGCARDAEKWIRNHRSEVEAIREAMPDGYYTADTNHNSCQVWDVDDLIEALHSLL